MNKKKISSNIYFTDTKNTILQPIACCEKVFKDWVFCFLVVFLWGVALLVLEVFVCLGVFLANLLFHLSSYLYQLSCLKKNKYPILAECLDLT